MLDPVVLPDLSQASRNKIEDAFAEAQATAVILFKAGAVEQALTAWDVIPAGLSR